nr:hypothetical protein CTI12_AA432400 [Tanacetum cinerariifolium]
MWRVYGIDGTTKNNSVVFFKFKSKEGMKTILESGPWMVNNVSLALNIWELGIWLEKVEPSTIPIWVYVYNVPMELCKGNGIGKIMSGVGKPMLMEKMTKERCLKKSRKLDFARVLVEVNAEEELPHEVLKGGGSVIDKGDNGNLDEYGFVEGGMKNMHVPLQSKPFQRNVTNYGPNNQSIQSKGFFRVIINKNSKNVKSKANIIADVKQSSSHKVSGDIMKPSVDLSNFNPKVLVRGSGSKSYCV